MFSDGVTVSLITPEGVERRDAQELPALIADAANLVWVDLPACALGDAERLRDIFGFHPLALRDTVERNHVSKLHVYADHVFLALHSPEIGPHGHVHYVELDQFIGRNSLVTVHGPYASLVAAETASLDTDGALRRIAAGATHPATPFEISSAIVASMIRRQIDLVARLAKRSGELEQRLTSDAFDIAGGDATAIEDFVEDLFETHHQLLAVRTIAAHSATAYDRMAHTLTAVDDSVRRDLADFADRFEQVVSMADGQREFVNGVIQFLRTKIDIHMALTADADAKTGVRQNDDMRKISAWVGIVAVPTAVTGFFGMNVPYPGFGTLPGFLVSLGVMLAGAAVLYVFFRRRRWL